MRLHRWMAPLAAASLILAIAAPAAAGQGGQLRIETGWYKGSEISFLQPSLFSSKPNGGMLGCFGLGPDLSRTDRPAAPLYVIFDSTAAEDHCDGDPSAFRHEHVLPVAPGDPGYTGAWRLVLLVEANASSRNLASDPFTNEQEVLDGMQDGSLLDVTALFAPDGPVIMVGPVIGGGSRS